MNTSPKLVTHTYLFYMNLNQIHRSSE